MTNEFQCETDDCTPNIRLSSGRECAFKNSGGGQKKYAKNLTDKCRLLFFKKKSGNMMQTSIM
jgi:hypothetical protein